MRTDVIPKKIKRMKKAQAQRVAAASMLVPPGLAGGILAVLSVQQETLTQYQSALSGLRRGMV